MQLEARITTDEDKDAGLPTYDYTALNAVATCPTYGITRYIRNLSPEPSDSREMALEAGQVIHECTAAMLLYQLELEGHHAHSLYHRERLFPSSPMESRHAQIFEPINPKESLGQQLRGICERVIASSGFYDDPNDTKRSITVIEDTLSAYIDRHPWTNTPVWIRDEDDPTSDVGIEMNVDMIVQVPYRHESTRTGYRPIRIIGRLDALHWVDSTKQEIKGIDYKTTSMNMTEAWDAGFRISPQPTGYAVYASLFAGLPVWRFDIHGMRLPVPARSPYNGIKMLPLTRGEHHIEQWLQWIDFCVTMIDRYYSTPQHAPKFTQACNRFFRPCTFLHMCDGDREWRDDVFNSLEENVWNPHES